MGERRMSEAALVEALSSLEITFPPTPALAPAVTARLVSERAARARPALPGLALWSRRRVLVLAAIGVLALLALAAAARLAIGAFEVRVQPDATPAPSASPVDPGYLGQATGLEEAQRATGFAIGLPVGPPPDEVYVVDGPSGEPGIVVAWQPGAPYPTIEGTKWSLVLMAFPGEADVGLKTVDRFEAVKEAVVDGRRAFWISVPHVIVFETDAGTRGPYEVLGNVLIWDTGDGISYRLETALDRPDAIALAETIS